MKFEEGHKLSRGRPKGSQNKDLKALRERVSDLIEDRYDKIVEDLAALTPKERIDAYIKLLEFVLPKLQRTALETDNTKGLILKVVTHSEMQESSEKAK